MGTAPVPVIAIDGPSASGKGTIASRVARALGFHYLDSGALYRALALAASRSGADWSDEAAVARIAAALDVRFADGAVVLAGDQVGERLRSEWLSEGASRVAALPAAREALVERQRAFRIPPGLVADGRDMGSVVFPDAELKVFLTASAEARAERRYKQLIEKGLSANIAHLSRDLRARDARDAARRVAPLQRCPDAVLLDTTDMTIEQVVQRVLDLVRDRRAR
jgi:3-phosphoshikimate 1-carboxyvinyltransferase